MTTPNDIQITIQNKISEITLLHECLTAFGQQHGVPDLMIKEVMCALEEIVANIIHYAYDDTAEHQIAVAIDFNGRALKLAITDDGKPFNPLDFPTPDVSQCFTEREDGGLGIHLARNLVDLIQYCAAQGQNRLTLVKNLPVKD